MMAEMTTRTMYRRNQMLCLRRLTLRLWAAPSVRLRGVSCRGWIFGMAGAAGMAGEPDARRWDRVSVCARVIPPVCGSCFTSISDSPGIPRKRNGAFSGKN